MVESYRREGVLYSEKRLTLLKGLYEEMVVGWIDPYSILLRANIKIDTIEADIIANQLHKDGLIEIQDDTDSLVGRIVRSRISGAGIDLIEKLAPSYFSPEEQNEMLEKLDLLEYRIKEEIQRGKIKIEVGQEIIFSRIEEGIEDMAEINTLLDELPSGAYIINIDGNTTRHVKSN